MKTNMANRFFKTHMKVLEGIIRTYVVFLVCTLKVVPKTEKNKNTLHRITPGLKTLGSNQLNLKMNKNNIDSIFLRRFKL